MCVVETKLRRMVDAGEGRFTWVCKLKKWAGRNLKKLNEDKGKVLHRLAEQEQRTLEFSG